MNADEWFKCTRFSLVVKRGCCAEMFKRYGRMRIIGQGNKRRAITDGMHTFGKSKAAAGKCTACPVGAQHARGEAADGCPSVTLSVVTFKPKPFTTRMCVCGEPARRGSRTCSLACANAHVGAAVEVDVTEGLPSRTL